MATPYDAAWKLLLSFPVLLHDLLAGFVPRAWVEHLDLSEPKDRSGSLVSNGLLQRHQDVVWRGALPRRNGLRPGRARVPVHRRPHHGGAHARLHRPALSGPAAKARIARASRTLGTSRTHRANRTHRRTRASPPDRDRPDSRESPDDEASTGDPPEPLPSVLPIVLYHGTAQWTAEEDMVGLCVPPTESLVPYQPAQRYFLLDLGHYSAPLPEGRNLFAILVRLVQSRRLEEEAAVVDALVEWAARGDRARGPGARVLDMDGLRSRHRPGAMRWAGRDSEDWREAGTMLRRIGERVDGEVARGRSNCGPGGRPNRGHAPRWRPGSSGRRPRTVSVERLTKVEDPDRVVEGRRVADRV